MGLRLLLDENVPGEAAPALAALGHDVRHVREITPGLPDADVLARATREGRPEMLAEALPPTPLVARRHAYETGTTRVFSWCDTPASSSSNR